MADPQGQAAANMRKSCQFCRSRKIRCSGGSICTTCRVKGLDCIYGREGSKGRPRLDKTRKKKPSPNGAHSGRSDPRPCERLDSMLTPPTEDDRDRVSTFPLGNELETIFDGLFAGVDAGLQATSTPIGFSSGAIHDGVDLQQYSWGPSNHDCPPVSYEELFFAISHGLVESTSTLFGSLGCTPTVSPFTNFFLKRLAVDQTAQMFDPPSASNDTDPFAHDEAHTRQLVELWFTHHPLSILVSKTLLLSQLRNGTVNRYLLTAILADAMHLLGDDGDESAQKLFAWSIETLCKDTQGPLSLCTIQALLIIGWHELCRASARRAYSFLRLARFSIAELQQRLQTEPVTSSDYINGISVADAELELIQRIYGFTFALELWGCMLLKLPLCPGIPEAVIDLPGLEMADSTVLRLDKASGNVATLQIHKRQLRLLWPMCHLALHLAPIYRLLPQVPNHPVSSPNQWNLGVPMSAPVILDPTVDITSITPNVHGMLAESLAEMSDARSPHPAHIFTSGAYRVILLHCLFPRSSDPNTLGNITPAILIFTIQILNKYKRLLDFADASPRHEAGIIDTPRRCNECLFEMGLDAAARAVDRLIDARAYGGSWAYQEAWDARIGEIYTVLAGYMPYCDNVKLQLAYGMHDVKKLFMMVNAKLSNLQHTTAMPVQSMESFEHSADDVRAWQSTIELMKSMSEPGSNNTWEMGELNPGLNWAFQ